MQNTNKFSPTSISARSIALSAVEIQKGNLFRSKIDAPFGRKRNYKQARAKRNNTHKDAISTRRRLQGRSRTAAADHHHSQKPRLRLTEKSELGPRSRRASPPLLSAPIPAARGGGKVAEGGEKKGRGEERGRPSKRDEGPFSILTHAFVSATLTGRIWQGEGGGHGIPFPAQDEQG